MCSADMNCYAIIVGECVDCGSPVDQDYISVEICDYSPVLCDVCGWAPCDGSC